jgi:nitrous oxidase accessory protein NosD
MSKFTLSSCSLIAALTLGLSAGPAGATSAISYVATGGTNNGPCSITNPCQTFAAAIANTTPGGVVTCNDSVLDTGPVTITKDVTIDCRKTLASIFGPFAQAISVNGANVTLRGLTILTDEGFNSVDGIVVGQGATVRVEDCKISGFTDAGILVQPSSGSTVLKVQDSTITRTGTGIKIVPSGGASVVAAISRSQVEKTAAAASEPIRRMG